MINPGENVVVIVGHPDGGKTHTSEQLAAQYPDYKVYHTDDYIPHGFEQSLYKLMEDIERDSPKKMIVEGVLGFRLLRKWDQQGGARKADLVIYAMREPRPDQKQSSDYMMRSQKKIWEDWYYSPGRHQSRIIYHK